MRQTQRFFQQNKDDIYDWLDPNLNFQFTPEILERVKSLLEIFRGHSQNDKMSNLPVLDVLTSIIIEAMQYCGLIPVPEDSEMGELDL